jgi:chemotaxis signal transduction protein
MQGGWVTVYNARPLLNVDRGRDGAAVLFARSSGRVALAVDDVFDAIVVAERELRPAPRSAAIGVVVGLLRRGNELIAVLDADALLDAVIAVREFEAEGETT